jgi:hypothetical protein
MCCPIAVSAWWPNTRSAPAFQLWLVPCSVLLMIASSDDDDRRQQPRRGQLAGAALIEPPLHRDVAKDQHAARHLAVLVADRRRAVIDRALRAVLAHEHRVVGQSDDHAVVQCARGRARDNLARVLVDDVEHALERLATRVGGRPAGERLGGLVHRGDPAGQVGGDHRVADAAQRDAQHFAAFVGAPLGPLHGLTEADDHPTREQVCDQPHDIAHVKIEAAARLDEEQRTGHVANQAGGHGDAIAAQPHRGSDGAVQRHQRQRVAQQWVEHPPQQHDGGQGASGQRVAKQRMAYAWILHHAS